jgi:hypothetical protein
MDHTSVLYNGRIWLLGGREFSAGENDVWYSSDGVKWTTATRHAQWSPRFGHTSVVHDGKMWVLGGAYLVNAIEHYLNDVWYSSDGTSWTQATASAAWSPRSLSR